MSFLTPLYILGLAAITLPILFHLIRRTPKGVQPFSSLMFIQPAPPRLTRRSRLDQLLLLLLRAAVLGLLAFAFARPFLRFASSTDVSDVSSRIYAILVDTSGSMRREGLWSQLEQEVEQVLASMGPNDRVALYSFGDQAERLARAEEGDTLEREGRRDLIRQRLRSLRPGWGSSSLAEAMILAADDLDALVEANEQATIRQLVVISDLQEGSELEPLQSYQWPKSVQVRFRNVTSEPAGNATLALLGALPDADPDADPQRGARVRVTNSGDATQQQFQVGWAAADDQPLGARVAVSVPPGESRVVHVPDLPPQSVPDHLQLTGDRHDFDNRFYVAHHVPEPGSLLYCGTDAPDDPEQLLFYIARAVTNDPWRPIELLTPGPPARAALQAGQLQMVIIAEPLEAELGVAVQQYLTQGGIGLVVLTAPELAAVAAQLTGSDLPTPKPVQADDYLMWSEIDFGHRLFRPFANPQYSDFSQIHFWKYHQVALPEDDTLWHPVVRYDNGDLALAQAAVGDGQLLLLTSSWRPEDSQLARSTKFVPLLLRLMGTDTPVQSAGVHVGDALDLPRITDASRASVVKPDGTVVPLASDQPTFTQTDQPGIYQVQVGDHPRSAAINLARAESQTTPLDIAQLEQRGVQLGDNLDYEAELAALRQMRDVELESRQGVWQWLIAAALVLLIVETVVAARQSRQTGLAVPESAAAADSV